MGMSIKPTMPAALKAAVDRETRGEVVRWSGVTGPGLHRWAAFGIWLFAIPWLAFALAWEGTVLAMLFKSGPPPIKQGNWPILWGWAFALFGLPFVLVGLGMMAAPFYALRKAARTVYALTDTRLLVIEAGGKATTVKTIIPQRIVSTSRIERSDGAGSLTLTLGAAKDSDGDTVIERETLMAVPQVQRLEQLLLDLGRDRR